MSPLLFRRLSDEQLGSRLASGEAAAFDELYRRYVHRLAAYGAHLLGDGAAGDDIAQASLLKAYTALRDGRLPAAMRPWLYRIAHNAAVDMLAKRRELAWGDLPDLPAVEVSPRAGALVEALSALPDRQRRVYTLREVHGLRIDETAAELGLTAAQVEQALFAARNRLAEHLVFGDRLDCVTVRRLAAGPLERDERRALKTHLRSCAACRSTAGARDRASALLPAFGWLRGLAGGLGGSAPVAAKLTAVVATTGLAAGVPGIAHLTDRPVRVPLPAHTVRRSDVQLPAQTSVQISARPASRPVLVAARSTPAPVTPADVVAPSTVHPATAHEDRHDSESSGSSSGGAEQPGLAAHDSGAEVGRTDSQHTDSQHADSQHAESEHTAASGTPLRVPVSAVGATGTEDRSGPGGDGGVDGGDDLTHAGSGDDASRRD